MCVLARHVASIKMCLVNKIDNLKLCYQKHNVGKSK